MKATVVEVTNPFSPNDNLEVHGVFSQISINNWLAQRFPGFVEFSYPTICLVNGKPLVRSKWHYIIKNKDVISFVRVAPTGVVVALVIAAIAVAASIYYANNIPKPNSATLPDQDPVYTLQGQNNRIRLMHPIEVAYGRVRLWPSYGAKSYNKFENDDQILYSLYCLGQGEFDIHRIQVEDSLASSFQDVETQIVPPGGELTLFRDNVVTSVEVSQIELFGQNQPEYQDWTGGFIANPTGTLADVLEIDVTFPMGLYFSNNDGGLNWINVSAEFEYRAVDDFGRPIGPWMLLDSFTIGNATVNAKRYTRTIQVSPARYEVRGRRTSVAFNNHRTGDKLVWAALRAFLPNTRHYGNVTMLAVKARATNNLNDNASNRWNVIATRKIPVWDPVNGWSEPVATRSIVWAFCDVFRSHYGGKLGDNFLDLHKLHKLDSEYNERNDYFDWIFDQKSTVWETARAVARVGRAVPILSGSRVTMVRDEPRTLPVAVFNEENIVKDSFRWDLKLFSMGEKDSVEIEYTDPESWTPEEVLCVLPGSEGNDPEKIKLAGCTNREQAYHEGMYIAAANYYIRQNITFRTGLEGHIPSFGDLISVAHDLPRWGQSGYVRAIHGRFIQLSNAVKFENEGNNYLVLRKRNGSAAGPYIVNKTRDPHVVELQVDLNDNFYIDEIHEPPLYQFGQADKWAKLCKVQNLRPSSDDTVEITCTAYDSRVYSFDHLPAPPPDKIEVPTVPDLPAVQNLRVNPMPETVQFVLVNWDASLGAIAYVLQESADGKSWSNVVRTTMTSHVHAVTRGILHLRVCAINVGAGPWTTWSGQVGSATGIPNDVREVSLQQPFFGTYVKIYWQSVSNASAYLVRTLRTGESDPIREAEVTTLQYTYSAENATQDQARSRRLTFEVYALNEHGQSEVPATLDVFNPPPAQLNGVYSKVIEETDKEVTYEVGWNANLEVDMLGYRVWAQDKEGEEVDFIPNASNLIYEGPGIVMTVKLQKNIPHYTKIKDGTWPFTEREVLTHYKSPEYLYKPAAYDVWDDEVNNSKTYTLPSRFYKIPEKP